MEKMNIVSEPILKQICLAKDLVEGDPHFNLVKRQKFYELLTRTANKHSVDIEMQNGFKKSKARRIALKNLTSAQNYISKSCGENFSEDSLKIAASLINNSDEEIMKYRNSGARTETFSGNYLVYPDYPQIPNLIYQFLTENKSIQNPVEKAIHSHFHIARIHPFIDGNGRLARLVQNCILDCAGFPPIVIEQRDRQNYLALIESAQRAYKEKDGRIAKDTSTFFNYLSMKLYDSFVEINKKISK